MSIRQEYAEAILEGSKRVEFRKRKLAPDIATVLVYTTMPIGRVTGAFEVDGIDVGSPTRIWDLHKRHSGISRAAYRNYFRGSSTAVGIRVAQARRFARPVRLEELVPGLRPPQSFLYLDAIHVELMSAEALAHPRTAPGDLAA